MKPQTWRLAGQKLAVGRAQNQAQNIKKGLRALESTATTTPHTDTRLHTTTPDWTPDIAADRCFSFHAKINS